MKKAEFAQLGDLARELLRMIDEGQSLPINVVCNSIENGSIVQVIATKCGFKNINVSPDTIPDVNALLKEKYASENEARNRGINKNGLVFIVYLIIDDLAGLLYQLKFNGINPEEFRQNMV